MARTLLFIPNSEMRIDIDHEIWKEVYNLVGKSAYEVLKWKGYVNFAIDVSVA